MNAFTLLGGLQAYPKEEVDAEIARLKEEVARLDAAYVNKDVEPCIQCEGLQHKAEAERDAAKAQLDGIVDSLLAFGWVVADPWDAKWSDPNCMEIVDAGPMCPVCGQAAPMSEKWPPGVTMYDPANHADDCRLAAVLKAKLGEVAKPCPVCYEPEPCIRHTAIGAPQPAPVTVCSCSGPWHTAMPECRGPFHVECAPAAHNFLDGECLKCGFIKPDEKGWQTK